jgi:hypothetical protein
MASANLHSSVGLVPYYLCGSPSARSSIWIERLTTDQKVGGSSPSGRAAEIPAMARVSVIDDFPKVSFQAAFLVAFLVEVRFRASKVPEEPASQHGIERLSERNGRSKGHPNGSVIKNTRVTAEIYLHGSKESDLAASDTLDAVLHG